MRLRLLLALAIPLLAIGAAHAQTLPNQPVAQLNLNRYMGLWHEIAHLPLFFQRKCVDNVTATYTLSKDGQIQVLNACRTADGKQETANGVARSSSTGLMGALQVRFAPEWLAWLPWVWADYWVIEVDPDYRWAVVGSPGRKYLWILSRAPSMSGAQFDAIRTRAAQRGYAVDSLKVDAPLD